MTKPDPTNAARQARFRENRAAQGITEVRGLYAPASIHAQIREAVRKLVEQSKQETPPRDSLTHQPGATMCKCTKPEPKPIRTEKHCDRIVSVYSDGRRVTNFLPRCA